MVRYIRGFILSMAMKPRLTLWEKKRDRLSLSLPF